MSTHTQQSNSSTSSRSSGQTSLAVNVGDGERIASTILGVTLATLGLRAKSLGGLAVAGGGAMLVYRGVSGYCGLYEKLGLKTTSPASPRKYSQHGIHVEVAITVDRETSDLYAFWRNLENLPQFMDHLQSVTKLDEKTSRWVVTGPAGTTVQWDAEIINDVPNETIAWRSLGGATVDNAGSVRFLPAPGGRGTELHVVLEYVPPGRSLGKWFARLFGEDPQLQIESDLRKFKQLMETGEVTTTNGQSRGDCGASRN